MNKLRLLAVVCCVIILALASCTKQNVVGTREQLIGRWQGTSPTSTGQFVVFYDSIAEEGFCWGKEWDENAGVYEEDLEYHGNGWFKWKKGNDYIRICTSLEISPSQGAMDWPLYVLDDKNMQLLNARQRWYLVKIE